MDDKKKNRILIMLAFVMFISIRQSHKLLLGKNIFKELQIA